jgi:hypothetical protein
VVRARLLRPCPQPHTSTTEPLHTHTRRDCEGAQWRRRVLTVEVAEVKGQYRTPSHPLVAALTAHLLAVVEVRVALTRPPSLLSRRVGREHIALSKCILSRPSRVATQPTLDEPPFVEQGARRFTVFGHCIVNCAFTHTHNLRAGVRPHSIAPTVFSPPGGRGDGSASLSPEHVRDAQARMSARANDTASFRTSSVGDAGPAVGGEPQASV